MSSAVPERFSSVVRAVEEVCSELSPEGSFRPIGDERWVRNVEVVWDEPVELVAFLLDADGPLLAVYVVLRLPCAVDHGDALAKAIARANYGLLPGCFELDLDTGETRYRSVLELPSGETDTQTVAQLLSRALQMAETYAPAFKRIVESGADPLAAVDEIEAGE